jgi:hypothetical protein
MWWKQDHVCSALPLATGMMSPEDRSPDRLGPLTCWLMSRMAMSFLSVKSWKAASITFVCVSVMVLAPFRLSPFFRLICPPVHSVGIGSEYGITTLTRVDDEKILLLLIIDMANPSEQQTGDRILESIRTPFTFHHEPRTLTRATFYLTPHAV